MRLFEEQGAVMIANHDSKEIGNEGRTVPDYQCVTGHLPGLIVLNGVVCLLHVRAAVN
jgi:hypothetical protein